MMLPLLLAALVDVAVQTSAHAGAGVPAEPGAGSVDGAELEPSAALHLRGFEARYAPRLIANGDGAFLNQAGSFALRVDEDRRLTWGLSARGSVGRTEVAFAPESLDYVVPLVSDGVSFDGAAALSYQLTRNLAVDASGGYFAYGGLSTASQQYVPLMRGPQADVDLRQTLTRSDELVYEAYTSYTFATGNRRTSLAKGTVAWNHALAPQTRFSLAAGASTDGPVASASLQHAQLSLRAAIGPHYSIATADLRERAEIEGGATWQATPALFLRGRAGAARELDSPGALALFAADAGFRITQRVSLTGGIETIRQRAATAPSASYGFIALTAQDFL